MEWLTSVALIKSTCINKGIPFILTCNRVSSKLASLSTAETSHIAGCLLQFVGNHCECQTKIFLQFQAGHCEIITTRNAFSIRSAISQLCKLCVQRSGFGSLFWTTIFLIFCIIWQSKILFFLLSLSLFLVSEGGNPKRRRSHEDFATYRLFTKTNDQTRVFLDVSANLVDHRLVS